MKRHLNTKSFSTYYVIGCVASIIMGLTVVPAMAQHYTTPEYKTYTEQVAAYPHPSIITELKAQRDFEAVIAGVAPPEMISDPDQRAIATELRDLGRSANEHGQSLRVVAIVTAADYIEARYDASRHNIHRWIECVGSERRNCSFTGALDILNEPRRLIQLWSADEAVATEAIASAPTKPELAPGTSEYVMPEPFLLLLSWLITSLGFTVAFLGSGLTMSRANTSDDPEQSWGNPLSQRPGSWFNYLLLAVHLPGYLLLTVLCHLGIAVNSALTKLHDKITEPRDRHERLQYSLEKALEDETVREHPELEKRLRVALSDLQSERERPNLKVVQELIEEAELHATALREAEDEMAAFDAALGKDATRK